MALGWGSLWALSKVEDSAHAPRLPRFILQVNVSDTLLVVSLLQSIRGLSVLCFCNKENSATSIRELNFLMETCNITLRKM